MERFNSIIVENKVYPVVIIRKRIKNIHFRFKNDHFEITCNRLVPSFTLKHYLEKHALKLLKKETSLSAIGENYIFIFGNKYPFVSPIYIEDKSIEFDSLDKLLIKMKDLLLDYAKERVTYYKKIMNIKKDMKIRISNSKRVLGSNSRATNTLSFSFRLVHFSKETIDSVIVHELSHCFIFNHSKAFYDVVYKYCPNYNLCRKKILKSVFE